MAEPVWRLPGARQSPGEDLPIKKFPFPSDYIPASQTREYQDEPEEYWGAVLFEDDGKGYTLLSDNPMIYSMMQTAIVMDEDIGVSGYPVPGKPGDTFSLWFPSYQVCFMDVSRI